MLWVACVLFIVVATPFEALQSGYVYLTKALCLAAILGYAVLACGARTGPLAILPVVVAFVVLVLNVSGDAAGRARLASVIIVLGTLLGQAQSADWDRKFVAIISVYTIFHTIGLIISWIVYIATGDILELHGILFPEDSRAESLESFARLSGFHTEPGTYSQWTLMSLFFLSLLKKKLLTPLHAIVGTSVALTTSLWAMFGVAVLYASFLVEALFVRRMTKKLRVLIYTAIFTILGWIVLVSVPNETIISVLEYLNVKGSLTTQSGIDKVVSVEFFAANFWDVLIIGGSMAPGFCPECISPQDAGIALNAIYYFGFVTFIVLFLGLGISLTRGWNVGFILLLAPLLVWKAQFYDPLLWALCGVIFSKRSAFNLRVKR